MFTIRIMTIDDYESVIDLMKRTPGVTFRDADSYEATRRYLERNPGLSFIATVDGETAGCVMSGHDGRRGYLQHLVVAPAHRRQGMAKTLIKCCVARLEVLGIAKSHVDVIKTNADAHAFWKQQGWHLRTDIDRYSFVSNGRPNA